MIPQLRDVVKVKERVRNDKSNYGGKYIFNFENFKYFPSLNSKAIKSRFETGK